MASDARELWKPGAATLAVTQHPPYTEAPECSEGAQLWVNVYHPWQVRG